MNVRMLRKPAIPDSRNHLTRDYSISKFYERFLEMHHMEYNAILSLEFED